MNKRRKNKNTRATNCLCIIYDKSVKYDVPQGAILGPLKFNKFLNKMYYFTGNTMGAQL